MMNIEEGDVNLGLSIQTRLSSDLGAGANANANSRVDLTFPPYAPLSELVWSPHNGLSLKSASSTRANESLDLLWNVGMSNADDTIVESSNSAGLLSRGMKRESFDKSEINVAKKMKGQTPDSSFMKWISNMVPTHCNKQDSSSHVLSLAKNCHEDLMSKKGKEISDLDCQINDVFSPRSITCYFCGGCHDLQCPNARKSELDQESSCLCIGCSHCTAWNVQISGTKIVLTSKERQTAFQTEGDHKLAETLGVIRNLRLSRADVLRWMNSNRSLSGLNGFFVRLRLGKMESGVDVPGYYVGCIAGDAKEVDGKKCVVVDVGGIKTCVPSQYVSNQDFLEDEINAWCCRILDSGTTIPSLEDLNSKFNYRKNLGF